MLRVILILSIPFLIIIVIAIIALHRTKPPEIEATNIKHISQKVLIKCIIFGLITTVVLIVCMIVMYPVPDIEIKWIEQDTANGIITSKSKLAGIYKPLYSILYCIGIYVEHPEEPGILHRAKEKVGKISWDGMWKFKDIEGIRESDIIHVFLLKRSAIKKSRYYKTIKKEKGYFLVKDRQIRYGKERDAEIVGYDAKIF